MKQIVDIKDGEGLEGLLGEKVLIFSLNYIYTGTLLGVNDTCIKLDNAQIVYETGSFNADSFKDAQELPTKEWYLQVSAIESFGRCKP